jgi:hypothetical protein
MKYQNIGESYGFEVNNLQRQFSNVQRGAENKSINPS